MLKVKGKILDGKNASAFSNCGNTRKIAERPKKQISSNDALNKS